MKERDDESPAPPMNSDGKIPRSFLLVIPGLLALGILLMFFTGKTGSPSKDLLYEDLESRMKRMEQRLARLEQTDQKSPQPNDLAARLNERVERLEKAIARTEGVMVEKQPRPEQTRPPEPLEKERRAGFHQVVEGDTLFKISRIYGVPVDDLRKWNNLPPGEGIRTGQRLRISAPQP